jgi:peptidoglycan/LPS O-acetylase OafA/YrhL
MSKPEARHLPALDGLRAVAVAAVVAFHLGRLRGGFLGVDVFFVVSGFLITRLLLAEWDEREKIDGRAFWARRFRRLLPALLVVLAAVAVASRAWLPAWRLTDIRDDALAALAYVANWRFVLSDQSYFARGIGPSPLRHTWSLAIEEQFYLLWPVLVLGALAVARRRGLDARRLVGVLATVGAVASGVWMAVLAGADGTDLSRVYYGTDTRAFALLAGAGLACWWDPAAARARRTRRSARRWREAWSAAGAVGLAALAVLAVTVREDQVSAYRGAFQLASALSVVTVAGCAAGDGRVNRFLGSNVPTWLGRRSYGIYLWSWPVQVFAVEHFGLGGWTLDLAVVTVTLVLAALSFRFVEAPVLSRRTPSPALPGHEEPVPVTAAGDRAMARWTSPVGAGSGRRAAAGALGVIGVVGLVVGVAAGAPPKPALLSVTDDEVESVALAPDSGFSDLEPTSSTTAPPTTQASTSTSLADPLGGDVVGVSPDPSTVVAASVPGPFPSSGDVVVRTAASDGSAALGRPLRVMVAGDSVGWSVAWSAGEDALTDSVQVSNRALVGCGVLPADTIRVPVSAPAEPYAPLCARAPEARGIGLAEGPDVVLLWIGAWEVFDQRVGETDLRVGTGRYAALLEDQLQVLVDEFRAAGVPTVLPLVPCFGPSPVYPVERLDPTRIAWVNARVRAVALRNRGWVRLVDPTAQLCGPDGKNRERNDDGVEIRPDGAHFESDSAVWFWNTWLAGQLAGAFTDRG